MAAPTLSTRGAPSGIRMEDGFPTKLSFAANPTVEVWERSIKPPGMDGGDPIPTSTMHNLAVHTFAPRSLIKYDPISVLVNYDPNVYLSLKALVNVRGSITIRWYDGSTLTFYGYLQKVEFSELKEGDEPEATLTV